MALVSTRYNSSRHTIGKLRTQCSIRLRHGSDILILRHQQITDKSPEYHTAVHVQMGVIDRLGRLS